MAIRKANSYTQTLLRTVSSHTPSSILHSDLLERAQWGQYMQRVRVDSGEMFFVQACCCGDATFFSALLMKCLCAQCLPPGLLVLSTQQLADRPRVPRQNGRQLIALENLMGLEGGTTATKHLDQCITLRSAGASFPL